jgi:hypothetical protein
MALSARHNWIVETISQSLNVSKPDVEAFVLQRKANIDAFLTEDGATPKLFVYNQPRDSSTDKQELFLSMGM